MFMCVDRARSVYLDHVGRLEGVANEAQVNGSLTGRMGDGLVSHKDSLPPQRRQAWRQEPGASVNKRRRVSAQV